MEWERGGRGKEREGEGKEREGKGEGEGKEREGKGEGGRVREREGITHDSSCITVSPSPTTLQQGVPCDLRMWLSQTLDELHKPQSKLMCLASGFSGQPHKNELCSV